MQQRAALERREQGQCHKGVDARRCVRRRSRSGRAVVAAAALPPSFSRREQHGRAAVGDQGCVAHPPIASIVLMSHDAPFAWTADMLDSRSCLQRALGAWGVASVQAWQRQRALVVRALPLTT